MRINKALIIGSLLVVLLLAGCGKKVCYVPPQPDINLECPKQDCVCECPVCEEVDCFNEVVGDIQEHQRQIKVLNKTIA